MRKNECKRLPTLFLIFFFISFFCSINQITLWGDSGEINDYAAKQWAGLVKDYYYERWLMFTDRVELALTSGTPIDFSQFESDIRARDIAWNLNQNTTQWSAVPTGQQVRLKV